MSGAEFALGPKARVFRDFLLRPSVRLPSESQEEFNWEFQRLEVADIHNPDSVRTVTISHVHLLPDFDDRRGVEPFVIARAAHVIKMIVDPCAARTFALFGSWQSPDVSPVVVAPEQRDIVRHAHTFFVIL